jgi:hypothetical protein
MKAAKSKKQSPTKKAFKEDQGNVAPYSLKPAPAPQLLNISSVSDSMNDESDTSNKRE